MPKGIYERKSEEQRFWEKVDIQGDDDCWPWIGSKDSDGYGWFCLNSPGNNCVKGKTVQAHRYSLMLKLKNFDLPFEVKTRHTCDKRDCVNPAHLCEGSAKDNSADMIERNRQICGEKHHSAKLTEADAIKILEEYTADKQSGRLYGSLERLAVKYNQSKQSIYRVTSGQTWKHLKRS
jgi:hypothetical protein